MYRSRKEDQRKNVAVERIQNRSRVWLFFFSIDECCYVCMLLGMKTAGESGNRNTCFHQNHK